MMPKNDLPDGFKETEIGPIPAEWEVVQMEAVSVIIVTKKVANNDQWPMLLVEGGEP